jgi:hypothetical protein
MHDLSPYLKQFEGVRKLVARRAVFVENKGGCVGSDAERPSVVNSKMGTRENVNEGKTQRHRLTNCGLKEEDTTDRYITRKRGFG